MEHEVVRLREEAFLDQGAGSYRAVLERSPVPMWINRDNRLVFLNTSALELLGASSPEQILGRSPFDFIHPEFREIARARLQQASERRGRVPILEERFVRLDGQVIEVEVSSSFLLFQGYGATLTNFWDITARKQAQQHVARLNQDLSHQVREFESLLDVIPIGIGVAEDRECRSTRMNRAFTKMLGTNVLERAYRNGQEIPAGQLPMQVAAREGVPVRELDLEVRRPDGQVVQVLCYACPVFDESGRTRGSLGAFVDITERKHLEDQLRQAQKMEAIGVLAGGVAHDFNNLLTIITGYGEILVSQLAQEKRLRDFAEEILHAADRAAGLTSQLLAFSRRQVFQPKVLSLPSVLASMDKMLRRIIGEDVELRTIVSPDVGRIKADLVQFEQVILNLAVNARDAMPEGGVLSVVVGNLELSGENSDDQIASLKPGSYVLITVTDTGCGMEPAVQARIFEPFFTTKGLGKGTGLGLSTVYGIVKQSGGEISVSSAPGQGATFRIYLPRIFESEKASEPTQRLQAAERASGTVLLVEDDPSVRKLAATVLDDAGYTVLEAGSIDEAVSWPMRHKGDIDLLVADVVMPQMSGPELAQSLRVVMSQLKVLFMSGYADSRLNHPDFLRDDVRLIQKPFTPGDLLKQVDEMMAPDQGKMP